jgi:hypothetical protein
MRYPMLRSASLVGFGLLSLSGFGSAPGDPSTQRKAEDPWTSCDAAGACWQTSWAGLSVSVQQGGASVHAGRRALSLGMRRFGRAGSMQAIAPVRPVNECQRTALHYDGVTEWYARDARGLEQGFDVATRPAGRGDLVIEVGAVGLSPALSGEAIELRDAHGRTVLRYGQLAVLDAEHRNVPASLAVEHDTIVLRVSDADARYPIVVDPTVWVQQGMLVAADGAASDHLGLTLDIAGNTVIAGANEKNASQGAAYVFVREGASWSQQAKLLASGAAADDQFGSDVGLDGDTVIIGASHKDVGGNASQGAAYVFVRSGASWVEQAMLTAAESAAGDAFGWSVDVNGDTAIVGAPFKDESGANGQGAAYVFVRTGGTWAEQAKLLPPDGAAGDMLGFTVRLDGDTAVVGATDKKIGAANNVGSAYVFVRSGATWTHQATLQSPLGVADSFFGHVAISGDTVVVGAREETIGANPGQGAAYVFTRSGTTWTQQARLTASDGAANARFGASLDIRNDNIVVGAPFQNVGASTDQGQTYLFSRVGTVWSESAKFNDPAPSDNEWFGCPRLSGSTVVVGASNKNSGQGVVYVFVSGLQDGDPCTAATECASGFCADGVCCDTACEGQCQACNIAQSAGKCVVVTGVPHGARPLCGSASAECAGTCDGTKSAACSYPGQGTPCGTPSCSAGSETKSFCNGQGACAANASSPCSPYVCGATACKQSCAADADCAQGMGCHGSVCEPSTAKCLDGETAQSGGSTVSCVPYACSAGKCLSHCTSDVDCATGHTCDLSKGMGTCIARSDAGAAGESSTDSGGGCGCRTQATSGSGQALWTLYALLLGACCRRRSARRMLPTR